MSDWEVDAMTWTPPPKPLFEVVWSGYYHEATDALCPTCGHSSVGGQVVWCPDHGWLESE